MPKHSDPPKPAVAIVGAGRLGRALAIALGESGYSVRALVARRASEAQKAAGLVSQTTEPIQALGLKDLEKLAPTGLTLITTPDDAIEQTAQNLAVLEKRRANLKPGKTRGRIVLHTSGALSSVVLSPLAELGFHTGSLHPLVSVSDPRSGAEDLRGAFYCVEGDRVATKLAQRIIGDFGGKSFSIAPASKALYHAAALTAAGHLTALIDLAMEMLASCGLSRSAAQKVLMPLVESAVHNLKNSPPEKALTGTFARGDVATVRRHLEALSGDEHAEALKVYKLLGLRSLRLAGKKGIDDKVLQKIRTLLK
ncbi:MAG TPA: Rossmann-like and DUF2520 domain-containing protein [Pyrinomonadaceae bacterium]|nr:Rossmann-like and DUF2520 domain-containing protein [Pyrinomonadaceae bacterium]